MQISTLNQPTFRSDFFFLHFTCHAASHGVLGDIFLSRYGHILRYSEHINKKEILYFRKIDLNRTYSLLFSK